MGRSLYSYMALAIQANDLCTFLNYMLAHFSGRWGQKGHAGVVRQVASRQRTQSLDVGRRQAGLCRDIPWSLVALAKDHLKGSPKNPGLFGLGCLVVRLPDPPFMSAHADTQLTLGVL